MNAPSLKYPALKPFEELLPELDRFDTIIDVRSPSEFKEDHIPGAINCPVLNDEERARVGTLYKQVNAFEAKKVGAALVARNIAQHIDQLFVSQDRNWKPLIYCWRGGNRSGSMAHILARIGWPAVQLEGGYKAYRQHVNQALSTLPAHFTFNVICGTTGSGKSRLLQTLAQYGAQVLDLEQLASHKGSVLGKSPDEVQPTQKSFESAIWNSLRNFTKDQVVFVESESKKIGNLRVPDALMDVMRSSPCTAVSLSTNERVKLLMEDYAHFVEDPQSLNSQLDCLLPLHGKEKISRWQSMAISGDIGPVVEELLALHYDPAYLRSIERNFSQFPLARHIQLADISTLSFSNAAKELLNI